MSIWHEIEKAASAVGNEAQSLGGVAIAVPGLVWDLAHVSDTFHGGWKHDLMKAGSRLTGPIADQGTISGMALAPLLEGDRWLYTNAVARPSSTSWGVYGQALATGDPGVLLNPDAWKQSYENSKTRSPGQSLLLAINAGADPLKPLDPNAYQALHQENPFLTSVASGSVDAIASWYLDPLVVGGKLAKIARIGRELRPITEAERANGLDFTEKTYNYGIAGVKPFKAQGLGARMDYLNGHLDNTGNFVKGHIDGRGPAELMLSIPELSKAPRGAQIANALAETNKITDVTQRINARNQIWRVLLGDHAAIADLQTEHKYIADMLDNISKGSVTAAQEGVIWDYAARGDKMGLFPAGSNPVDIAEAERQLNNIPSLEDQLVSAERHYRALLGSASDAGDPGLMGALNGVRLPTAASIRKEGRVLNNAGMLRSGVANTGHAGTDEILNRTIGRPVQWVFQNNSSSMPLRVISGYTAKSLHAGPVFIDSFSRRMPGGIYNLNDQEETYRKADNVLRFLKADSDTYRKFIDKLAAATGPYARKRVLEDIDAYAHEQIFTKHGFDMSDPAHKAVADRAVAKYQEAQRALASSLQARSTAYSATLRPKTDPLYQEMIARAKKRGEENPESWRTLRVDQRDENGVATSLPFADTQDAVYHFGLDMTELDKVLRRHGSLFRAAAHSWRNENPVGEVAKLKNDLSGAAIFGAELKDSVFDGVTQVLDMVNRTWKFSILLRLGYPLRVVGDDETRIIAGLGAQVAMHNIGAGIKNVVLNRRNKGFNVWEEKRIQAEVAHLTDHVGTPELYAQNQAVYAELAKIEKKLTRKAPPLDTESDVFRQSARDWTSGERNQSVPAVLRRAFGESESTTTAPLYRGARDRNLQVGDVVDRDLASFSENRHNGEMFVNARHPGNTQGALYVVEGEKRTLPIPGPEGEHLLAGQFRVTGVRDVDVNGQRVKEYTLSPVSQPAAERQLALKSVKRRAELEARRQTLLENNPVNLIDDKRRLEALQESLRTGDFKRAKRHIGDEGWDFTYGGQVYHAPGSQEGDYGLAFRRENSQQSFQVIGRDQAQNRQQSLSRSSSFRTISPTDPQVTEEQHLAAWEYAINHHIRQSEVFRPALEGGDTHAFLRSTRGREIREQFPWHSNAERWSGDIERMADEYLPTQELRDIALRREVTMEDLRSQVPDPARRPVVHGSTVDMTAATTGRLSHGMNAPLRTLANKFYGVIGHFNDTMTRHPAFDAYYRMEYDRLAHLRAGVAAKGGEKLTTADLNKIAHASREYAKSKVNKLLFDMAGETELAHYARFLSPFLGAWQEGVSRWWNLMSADPSVLRRFLMVFDAPRQLGLVVDTNTGELVKPGEPISDNHRILFQLPEAWGGKSPVTKDGAPAYQSPLGVSETSFNLITQGGGIFNPGFGPIIQLPVNQYAINHPEDKDINTLVKAVMPLGTTPYGLTGTFASGVERYGITVVAAKWFNHHTAQYNQMQNMILQDELVKWGLSHTNKDGSVQQPTQAQLGQLIADSDHKVMSMGVLKLASAALSPAAIQVQSEFTPQMWAYRNLEAQAAADNKPNFWADDQFVKQYGEAYFPLTQSASLNHAGLYSNQGTVASLKAHRSLENKVDPSLYRAIVGAESGGYSYDQTSRNYLYTHQLEPGSSANYIDIEDPRTAMLDSIVASGWRDYNKFLARLTLTAQAQGHASFVGNDTLEAMKRRGVQRLAQQNPEWYQAYSTHADAQYDATYADLKTIAADKTLSSDPRRNDIKVLQQYIGLRDHILTVLDWRAHHGGSSSPQAQSNLDVLRVYTNQVAGMVESDTNFQDYLYSGIIEHDPLLLDNASLKAAVAA